MRYHKVTNRLSTLIYSVTNGDLPKAIELETLSACNGGCQFCPVNRFVDPRPRAEMPMPLIEKLADELSEANYSGHLALFSNNEPLLDKRLTEICALLRARLPKAWLYLYTNGTPLTPALYVELARAGLDEMLINNYSDELVLRKQVQRVIDEISDSSDPAVMRLRARTLIHVRPENEVLGARGGLAPNKQQGPQAPYFHRESCGVPYMQMVIRPSGEVSLCCQDALGQFTLGDVSKQSIREVWRGEAYKSFRRRLEVEGRGPLDLCRECDAHLLYIPVLKRMLR